MKTSEELDRITQTIKTLEDLPEHDTESFRIVLTTLRQKENALLKVVAQLNS